MFICRCTSRSWFFNIFVCHSWEYGCDGCISPESSQYRTRRKDVMCEQNILSAFKCDILRDSTYFSWSASHTYSDQYTEVQTFSRDHSTLSGTLPSEMAGDIAAAKVEFIVQPSNKTRWATIWQQCMFPLDLSVRDFHHFSAISCSLVLSSSRLVSPAAITCYVESQLIADMCWSSRCVLPSHLHRISAYLHIELLQIPIWEWQPVYSSLWGVQWWKAISYYSGKLS